MLNKLLSIMEKSGQRMKAYFEAENREISYKGEIDLVTEYDVALEKELTASFNKAFPDFEVVGEESSSPDTGLLPGKVIYLDPIDGTTSFVHRFPFTCISAGVYVDKEPYCGVVCAPVLGEVYYAARGGGAYCNGKRIHVSQTDTPLHSLFSTGFAYDREKRRKSVELFARMLDISQGMRRTGSAALDLCYVGKGVFDMYYESTLKPWDMAAGIIIAQEAGGLVTDINGGTHDLSQSLILATNGIVHEAYLNEIRSVL